MQNQDKYFFFKYKLSFENISTIICIDNKETVPKQYATENKEEYPQRGDSQSTVLKEIKTSILSSN